MTYLSKGVDWFLETWIGGFLFMVVMMFMPAALFAVPVAAFALISHIICPTECQAQRQAARQVAQEQVFERRRSLYEDCLAERFQIAQAAERPEDLGYMPDCDAIGPLYEGDRP